MFRSIREKVRGLAALRPFVCKYMLLSLDDSYIQVRTLGGVRSTHAERVETVAAQLRAWNANGRKGVLRTARPNWQAMSVKLASNKGDSCRIDTSPLSHILEVDTVGMTLTAEPGVTMGQVTCNLISQ